ncbi:chitinase [Culex quinquefasciatus]|uniref:Chitinase n=1 Tax=Culex quinquefasciatus TaxID=7176 RepID=B0VZ32_CULQU|nr:chitinase [Culex quinquefasciatus]|eukprot:XP_001841677.1 chitinase [Culex quinquefasciatus]
MTTALCPTVSPVRENMRSHKDVENVVCYYATWATYRPGDGKFDVENIDPNLCTHLMYAFFGLKPDGTVDFIDTWNDLPVNGGLNAIARFNNLKRKNPSLKTLAAIGGWNFGSATFSMIAKSATLRSKFATEARAFCQKFGFDGIDIDWEYPAQQDGDPSVDKANFVLLLKDLKTELKKYGLLLTVAVGAAESSASQSYDIPQISNNVDFINLMEYDFHMASEGVTGHNAPLKARSAELNTWKNELNVYSSVQYWLSKGAPASKLNLGMPLYGHTFTLASASNNGVGAPVTGPGVKGPYTRADGTLGYNEICERKLTGTWKEVFDNEQMVPYAYSGNQWIGYDNVKSITEKQHSCSPVPTNTKIRHDVRRSSVADDATTTSTTPTSSSSSSSSRSTSVSSDSTSASARSESTTPLLVTGSDLVHGSPATTDFIKLAEIFEDSVEANGKVKAKRDVPLRGVDEHENGDSLSFKPEHNENEDDLAVAETHLFRPLFKYKSINSERRHIRQPTVTSTTTK